MLSVGLYGRSNGWLFVDLFMDLMMILQDEGLKKVQRTAYYNRDIIFKTQDQLHVLVKTVESKTRPGALVPTVVGFCLVNEDGCIGLMETFQRRQGYGRSMMYMLCGQGYDPHPGPCVVPDSADFWEKMRLELMILTFR
jgi:hypothetical protein